MREVEQSREVVKNVTEELKEECSTPCPDPEKGEQKEEEKGEEGKNDTNNTKDGNSDDVEVRNVLSVSLSLNYMYCIHKFLILCTHRMCLHYFSIVLLIDCRGNVHTIHPK